RCGSGATVEAVPERTRATGRQVEVAMRGRSRTRPDAVPEEPAAAAGETRAGSVGEPAEAGPTFAGVAAEPVEAGSTRSGAAGEPAEAGPTDAGVAGEPAEAGEASPGGPGTAATGERVRPGTVAGALATAFFCWHAWAVL